MYDPKLKLDLLHGINKANNKKYKHLLNDYHSIISTIPFYYTYQDYFNFLHRTVL